MPEGPHLPHLTLCADDYGLSEGVNRGICRLVRQGRLNAVSCMAGAPALDPAALMDAVAAAPIPVAIGLHLTLTEYAPLGPMPRLAPDDALPGIGRVLMTAFRGGLDAVEVGAEIDRQYRRFEEVFGARPTFLDGHQHVHLVPCMRNSVVALAAAQPAGFLVRSCRVPWSHQLRLTDLRASFLSALDRPLSRRLRLEGVAANIAFYGVNRFVPGMDFGALMRRWLGLAAAQQEPALIMCHPGEAAPPGTWPDPIALRRPEELAYLTNDDFPADLAAAGFTLG